MTSSELLLVIIGVVIFVAFIAWVIIVTLIEFQKLHRELDRLLWLQEGRQGARESDPKEPNEERKPAGAPAKNKKEKEEK